MKLNASASYGSLCRIAFETQQNALYGSRSRYVLCIEKMSGQDLTKSRSQNCLSKKLKAMIELAR
ncbi:hypothetical protein [Leptospira kirschneri]|uniref:hypothetical protein n=1 Tax=Leptospira kirschneri TaxID=29507 RepID=UPI0009B65628